MNQTVRAGAPAGPEHRTIRARRRADPFFVPFGRGGADEWIVHAELASPVPVVVYVWPEGGRVASAGSEINPVSADWVVLQLHAAKRLDVAWSDLYCRRCRLR